MGFDPCFRFFFRHSREGGNPVGLSGGCVLRKGWCLRHQVGSRLRGNGGWGLWQRRTRWRRAPGIGFVSSKKLWCLWNQRLTRTVL